MASSCQETRYVIATITTDYQVIIFAHPDDNFWYSSESPGAVVLYKSPPSLWGEYRRSEWEPQVHYFENLSQDEIRAEVMAALL